MVLFSTYFITWYPRYEYLKIRLQVNKQSLIFSYVPCCGQSNKESNNSLSTPLQKYSMKYVSCRKLSPKTVLQRSVHQFCSEEYNMTCAAWQNILLLTGHILLKTARSTNMTVSQISCMVPVVLETCSTSTTIYGSGYLTTSITDSLT